MSTRSSDEIASDPYVVTGGNDRLLRIMIRETDDVYVRRSLTLACVRVFRVASLA